MKLSSSAIPSSEGFKANVEGHLAALKEINDAAAAAALGVVRSLVSGT